MKHKITYIKSLAAIATFFCAVIFSYGQTTWNGAVWSAGQPTLTDAATINGNYNTGVDGSFSALSLTVNNGFTLTIDNGDYIEIQNNIVADGNITVETQGAVVQINNAAIVTGAGTITVIKTTAPSDVWYEYTYWSSPVSGETIGDALAETEADRRFKFNASLFLDATMETGNNNATVAGQDDIDDDGNVWEAVNGTDTMISGVGYASTQSEFSWNVAPGIANKTFDYTFEGLFNNGIINVPVDRNDGSILDNNWNLIGNPYPSAIDIDLFFTENNYDAATNTTGTIEGAIYFWSQNTAPSTTANGNENLNFAASDYATHNGTGGNAGGDGVTPNGFIPSGQGFFVSFAQARPTNTGNVVFNNAMRVKGATDNTQFFRSTEKQSNNANKLWVNLTSDNGVFNQTLIGYVSGATTNYDGSYYDAPRNLSTRAAAILYSNIKDSSKKFAIQGKAKNNINKDEVISLGFKTAIDVPTIYTLSIAQIEGDFLSNNAIYVKDNLLNNLHNLKVGDYDFTSEVGEFNNRFEIVFSEDALSINDLITDENALTI